MVAKPAVTSGAIRLIVYTCGFPRAGLSHQPMPSLGFSALRLEGTVAPDSSMETGFFSGVDYPELPHLSPLSSCVLHPGHSANLHRTQPEGPLQAPFSALLLKLAQLPNQYGLLWVSFPLIF